MEQYSLCPCIRRVKCWWDSWGMTNILQLSLGRFRMEVCFPFSYGGGVAHSTYSEKVSEYIDTLT